MKDLEQQRGSLGFYFYLQQITCLGGLAAKDGESDYMSHLIPYRRYDMKILIHHEGCKAKW